MSRDTNTFLMSGFSGVESFSLPTVEEVGYTHIHTANGLYIDMYSVRTHANQWVIHMYLYN